MLIAALLLLLALPGVQGQLQTSFCACDGTDCVSSSTEYNTGTDGTVNSLKEASFSGGVTMSRSLSATGTESLEESITSYSTDTVPDVATAFYKVVNAESIIGNYVSAASGLANAYAEVGLTAVNAESILAGASAISNTGMKADVSTGVTDGSLVNYRAHASADETYASAHQQFDSASGENVQVLSSSSTPADYSASSSIEANNALLNQYTGDANADVTGANVYQQIYGGWTLEGLDGDISAITESYDSAGSYAKTDAEVKNGRFSYLSSDAGTDGSNTHSNRQISGAIGETIRFGAKSNGQNVNAESTALLEGGVDSSASLESSSASASASSGQAYAHNGVGNANGAHILAQSKASRTQAVLAAKGEVPTDFQAQTSAEVFNGGLSNEWSSFSANAYDDSYSEDYFQPGYANTATWFIAHGDSISTSNGGSNSAGQQASAGAQISKGSIGDYSDGSSASMEGTGGWHSLYAVTGERADFGGLASDDNSHVTAGAIVAAVPPETEVSEGMPQISVDSIYSSSSANIDGTNAGSSVGNAQGGYIHAGYEAQKPDNLRSWGGIDLLGWESEGNPASLNGYFHADYSTGYDYSPEGISGSLSTESANGQSIGFGAGSDNPEGDHSEIYGLVDKGYLAGYSFDSGAASVYTSASVNPFYDYWPSISGRRVELGWSARNAEGDQISGKTIAQANLPETEPPIGIEEMTSINNYRSDVSATARSVQSREDIFDAHGLQVSSDWSANNREGDRLNGMVSAKGDGTSEGEGIFLAYLSGGKLTQASKRSVSAEQGGNSWFDEYGHEQNADHFGVSGLQSDAVWNSNDKQGEKVEGSAQVQNGFLSFSTQQSSKPFAVNSNADWEASAESLQMSWSASDKKKDKATVTALGAFGHIKGESSLSARTNSAEASSSVDGEIYEENGVVGFGLQAQNKNNDLVTSGASTRTGKLVASNHAKATTAAAEGSEDLQSDAGQTEISWLTQNKEGDTANGYTNILDGYVEASNSVKATKTSSEGSENIEVDAIGIDSQSSSMNARGDIAQTYMKTAEAAPAADAPASDVPETPDTTYALYSSSAKATKATAYALQDVTDSEGSFIAGGRTGHAVPSSARSKASAVVTYNQGALSEVEVKDGSEVLSSSSFQSDAKGATALQTVNTENNYGRITLYGGSGKGYLVDEISDMSELTTYSGIQVMDGSRFSSSVDAVAQWSKGNKPALTATALQESDVAGASIAKWRGAAYSFDSSTRKFAGSVHSQVMVTEGTMVSRDSAEAKKDSAIVKSLKLEAAGEGIERWFEAHCAVGDVAMDAKVTSGTLKDSSYSASVAPTTATLSGKWSATGATINKNGYAKSVGKTTPVTINKDYTSPAKNIADSAQATKTKQKIS